jgi:hypothetical protein
MTRKAPIKVNKAPIKVLAPGKVKTSPKAPDKAKSSRKAKRELPLDDPRWFPLIEALKQLSPQTRFATFDLLEKLKRGEARCLRRNLTNPSERELVFASFWQDVEIDETMVNFGSVQIYRVPAIRVTPEKFQLPRKRLDEGWAFYVWKPDLAKAWPAQQPDDGKTAARAKPGTKPTGDWHTLIAQWLIEVATEDARRLQNVDTLVVEASAFLEAEIDWAPAEPKSLRKRIVELLNRVRS